MDFIKKNQITIATAVFIGLGLVVYSMFFKSDAASDLNDASAQAIGGEVLELNASLQAVTLDQSLFNYTLYKSLRDLSTNLPSQPTGRYNPFDIIGRD
jgi:hypothetical protein